MNICLAWPPARTCDDIKEYARLTTERGSRRVEATVDPVNAAWREIAEHVQPTGLTLEALAWNQAPFLNSSNETRHHALTHCLELLQYAASSGMHRLSLNFVAEDRGLRPDDVERFAIDAAGALRFEAEAAAIRVACRIDVSALCVSPVDVRRWIDAANSYWIGADIDLSACASPGPAEWLEILSHRIVSVRISTPSSVNLKDLESSLMMLQAAGYEGPLTLPLEAPPGAHAGDAADASQ
jgi:sugar phosphate isomerase/epimerase